MDGDGFDEAELDALEHVVRDASAEPMELSLQLLKHITNNFSEKSVIGMGGSAKVYLGKLSNVVIAVKRLTSEIEDSAFENEVSMTMMSAHENIVRLIGYCCHTQEELLAHNGKFVSVEVRERLICTEYEPMGSLERPIFDDTSADGFNGGLEWNLRYQILKGICRGLGHLHNKVHVVHGDIKPSNILLGGNLVPRIYDFGLSWCFHGKEDSFILQSTGAETLWSYGKDRTMAIGTFGYMAPEIIETGRSSTKSDIFSLGVTILKFLLGWEWSWGEQGVEQALKRMRKMLVKQGPFSSWENKYHQVRTCLQIGYDCADIDPDRRPTALNIIQLLDETESTSCSAPSLWQLVDEESDSSDTKAFEAETTTDFLANDEEPASADTGGETSIHEPNKPDLVSNLPALVELSDLKVLEKITDGFSHERIVGKDGYQYPKPKAFVYKGDIPHRKMVAVKRLIGVNIEVATFTSKAQQFMALDHKNIVKVAGYCQDESTTCRRVHFKGEPEPIPIKGPEQLVCYEYMHNGCLRDYLIGQGSHEIDWHARYKLIKGTCEGLHYLHKNGGIVHLNLSPSNVLLDDNNAPQITGFDFSKLIGEKNTKSVAVQTKGSALAYMPPEFFYKKDTDYNYFRTVDIYSLGLMIIEIVTPEKIKVYKHASLIKTVEENWREESQLARLYTSLEADKLWQVKLCIDIGLRCVKSMPEKRPTAGNIVRWLDKGSKPVAAPRASAGVPRPPARTSVTRDDHIQGKEKRTGLMKRIFG